METFLDILAYVLPTLALALTTVLVPLAVLATKWLLSRIGLERLMTDHEIEDALRGVIDGGISFAEQKAANAIRESGASLEGPEKMDEALSWVIGETRARGLPEIDGERLERLVESRLGHPDAPGGVVSPLPAVLRDDRTRTTPPPAMIPPPLNPETER